MTSIRTTRVVLDLSADIADRVRSRTAEEGRAFDEVVTDLLVEGLPSVVAEAVANGLAASLARSRPIDVEARLTSTALRVELAQEKLDRMGRLPAEHSAAHGCSVETASTNGDAPAIARRSIPDAFIPPTSSSSSVQLDVPMKGSSSDGTLT